MTFKDDNKKAISLDNARKIGVMNMTKKDSFKGFKKVWCALKDGVLYIFTQEKVLIFSLIFTCRILRLELPNLLKIFPIVQLEIQSLVSRLKTCRDTS